MAENIKGNHDGHDGENKTYTIPGRGKVLREQLVKEIENGRHPRFSVYEKDKVKYVRSNPDSSGSNNVNK